MQTNQEILDRQADEHEAMARVNDRYVGAIRATYDRTDGRSSTANAAIHQQSAAKHRRIAAQLRAGDPAPKWHE